MIDGKKKKKANNQQWHQQKACSAGNVNKELWLRPEAMWRKRNMKTVFTEGRALTRNKIRWGSDKLDEATDWHDDRQSFPPCFQHRSQTVVPKMEACHQNLQGRAQ